MNEHIDYGRDNREYAEQWDIGERVDTRSALVEVVLNAVAVGLLLAFTFYMLWIVACVAGLMTTVIR